MRPLDEGETLARFARDSGHFKGGRPRWKLFEPARIDNSTSVFRTEGLGEPEIWQLGDVHATVDGRQPVARAELTPRDVSEVSLSIEADDSPPRHAAIVGWPDRKDALMERMRELASALASRAVLRIRA